MAPSPEHGRLSEAAAALPLPPRMPLPPPCRCLPACRCLPLAPPPLHHLFQAPERIAIRAQAPRRPPSDRRRGAALARRAPDQLLRAEGACADAPGRAVRALRIPMPLRALRGGAIKCNQVQSRAITCNQGQSSGTRALRGGARRASRAWAERRGGREQRRGRRGRSRGRGGRGRPAAARGGEAARRGAASAAAGGASVGRGAVITSVITSRPNRGITPRRRGGRFA